MSRLRLTVTANGAVVFEGDADVCTLVYADTHNDDAPVVSMWGDGNNGLWIYNPDDNEPWQVMLTSGESHGN